MIERFTYGDVLDLHVNESLEREYVIPSLPLSIC